MSPQHSDPTVQLTQEGVTVATLVRAIVPDENVRVTSASTVTELNNTNIHPTGGRVAELTDGSIAIGDGDAWQDAQTWVSTIANGDVYQQRGAPTTDELADGERMLYVSDGSDGNSAGDLVSARNNGGSIVAQVVAAASGDA